MRTITLNTVTGKAVEIEYSYEKRIVDDIIYSDGYEINAGKKEEVKETVTVIANGMKFDAEIRSCGVWTENKIKELCDSVEADLYLKAGKVAFIFAKEDLEMLKACIKAEREEGTEKELLKKEEERKEMEMKETIETAKRIIAAAKNTVKKNGKLMTEEEAKAWKEEYNDIANEGGAGCIPNVITREAFNWAIKVTDMHE